MRGGFICDTLINDNISSLLHGTSLATFDLIVKSGELHCAEGNSQIKRGKKLNSGVFFQPILKCNFTKPVRKVNCMRPIMMIFSTSLLSTRDNYHISTENCAGMSFPPALHINGDENKEKMCTRTKSYTKEQLDQYFKDNKLEEVGVCNQNNGFTIHELVFYEAIPLSYLEEVWICGHEGPFTQWFSRPARKDLEHEKDKNYVRGGAILDFNPEEAMNTVRAILDSAGLQRVSIKIIKTLPDISHNEGCDN